MGKGKGRDFAKGEPKWLVHRHGSSKPASADRAERAIEKRQRSDIRNMLNSWRLARNSETR